MPRSKPKSAPLLHGQDGLPDAVLEHLRGKQVLAWTLFDSDHDIVQYACCSTCGKFLLVPCFWPHFVLLSPCLLASCIGKINLIASQYWVLTETDLRIIHLDHDTTCLPYCWRTGVSVRTIPLEKISDIGLDSRGRGVLNLCVGDVPVISVETAALSDKKQDNDESRGIGLHNHQWFVEQVLDQVELVRNPVRTNRLGNRNDKSDKSSLERMQELKTLHERGFVSTEEYEQQRQMILQAI